MRAPYPRPHHVLEACFLSSTKRPQFRQVGEGAFLLHAAEVLARFQSHWRRSGCALHLYHGDFGAQRPGGDLGYLQSTRAGKERMAWERSISGSRNGPDTSFSSRCMVWVQAASNHAGSSVRCVHSHQPAHLRGIVGFAAPFTHPSRMCLEKYPEEPWAVVLTRKAPQAPTTG